MRIKALPLSSIFLTGIFGAAVCAAGTLKNAGDISTGGFSVPTAAQEAVRNSTLETTESLLNKVREVNFAMYSDLQSFVCNEKIARFRGYSDASKKRKIDSVSADLSFENGIEQYSNITQDGERRAGMASLGGAWSVGEFGTLLRQTEQLLGTSKVSFVEYGVVDNAPTAIFSFEVTAEESPWELQSGGQHLPLAFHTVVWVSRSTGQILKIERTSGTAPKHLGISEIRWSLTLKPTVLNGQTWILPSTGEYVVLYQGADRREWNLMEFNSYRRYGSEVAVRFQ